MVKTRQMMIHEIVDRLIGPTDVWCETNHDNQAIENMKELEELTYYLISKVRDNYDYRGRHEVSAQALAKQAERILKEIRCMTSDVDED